MVSVACLQESQGNTIGKHRNNYRIREGGVAAAWTAEARAAKRVYGKIRPENTANENEKSNVPAEVLAAKLQKLRELANRRRQLDLDQRMKHRDYKDQKAKRTEYRVNAPPSILIKRLLQSTSRDG